MAYRAVTALAVVATALLAVPAHAARVESNPTLRVMLHPDAAPGGVTAATLGRLERLARAPLALGPRTRTGAYEVAVSGPRTAAELETIARRLRNDRAVLWAQNGASGATLSGKRSPQEAQAPARKLLVRFADAGEPDWSAMLPRLSAQAGQPLAVERSIGGVHVLTMPRSLPLAQVEALAEAMQQDPAVRYVDAVRRLRATAAPNDPLFGSQWSLTQALSGINLQPAWDLGGPIAPVTVAVVDTGILDHPDLANRLLPGYDFISDADSARDGNGRDPDPRDEGDWIDDGDCGGYAGEPSFWHGLFVTGLIAANTNNGVGIAGISPSARIVPVRALGKCGGTVEDVFEAMLWAAGVRVPGVPPNPNPAKVINLSLGGYGSCGGALQEAVDVALAQGTVIVVSAGNETDDAQSYAPGNCGGVINVGATNREGDRTFYSNFGRRVDISAPGGEGDRSGMIVSLFNRGTQGPGEPAYAYAMGTSFSAPMVTGTVAMMLARNPNLTAGRVLSIVQGSARDFPQGSTCGIGGVCGTGLLDAGAAVASTIPAVVDLPPGGVAVVEYYDAELDHFTVSADPVEIDMLDSSGWWQRTGHVFYAWADPALAPAPVQPVCRFYASQAFLIDSYFFSADPSECSYLLANGAPKWMPETFAAFYIEVPGVEGTCRPGTIPVYRFFNNREDASQRFTIDLSVKRAMVNRAWVPDGPGQNGAAFCSLI